MSENMLKLGLPSGSLQQAVLELFGKAGYVISQTSRSYYPQIDDPEIDCTLLRAQEIARYVADGVLDCGLTGHDWIMESGVEVVELGELVLSKVSRRPVRWVLAVPRIRRFSRSRTWKASGSPPRSLNLTRRWLAEHGVNAHVEFSWGATEAKPPLAGRCDRRGHRNRQLAQGEQPSNRLRPAPEHDAVYRQSPGQPATPGKSARWTTFSSCSGAINAEGKVGLMMNVREETS